MWYELRSKGTVLEGQGGSTDSLIGFPQLLPNFEKIKQTREAELLTMDYERSRLKHLGIDKGPEWRALDDSFAGYDVLSYDPGGFTPINRMIEVKITTASPLGFVVTRDEWERAQTFGPAYLFHVWNMQTTPPVLYERTPEQVGPHIPSDNGKGRWTTVEIPLDI
jgi:hypothetical protein